MILKDLLLSLHRVLIRNLKRRNPIRGILILQNRLVNL